MEAQRYALTHAEGTFQIKWESDFARDCRVTEIFVNLDLDFDVVRPVLDVPARDHLMELNKAQWLAYTPCISRASRKRRIDAAQSEIRAILEVTLEMIGTRYTSNPCFAAY